MVRQIKREVNGEPSCSINGRFNGTTFSYFIVVNLNVVAVNEVICRTKNDR